MVNVMAVLAFPVWVEGRSYGSHIEMTEAMDMFALFTLGTLFFILGIIAAWAWMLWRRNNRPQPHEQLLMELHHDDDDEATPAGDAPPSTAGEPWEREADWWRRKC